MALYCCCFVWQMTQQSTQLTDCCKLHCMVSIESTSKNYLGIWVDNVLSSSVLWASIGGLGSLV